jgi:hypothetical protein
MIETNEYNDVLVEVIIPDPFSTEDADEAAPPVEQQTLEIANA